ncbi:MAG: hypothetical protein PHH59_14515 [Methylovulum sp.]|uniref:hypothetical protein n=1 Tax=Methylovulum sp. TaxID=1916980 RepID=UPI00262E88CB|nr:hypothetical protein [Methylovulum sp.]MDD2725218.1 hypothetical protein [Methylovulum sp.]MDD5126042.1 hypothetical protein [Methylovulum sp.]
MEKWLELLMLGPADVRDLLLEKCSDFFRKEIEAYRQAEADVLVYADPYGSTDTIPMKLFKCHRIHDVASPLPRRTGD